MAYTNIDDPSAYFTTTLWTGAGGSPRAITNDANSGNFQPDFVWSKGRNEAYEHQLYDSSRGAGTTKGLTSNDASAEGTVSATYGYLSSFDSNGFTGTAGTSGQNAYFDTNAKTYAAWQWKANGGTTSSNTDGSITSTVQANQDAGFSIVTYTGIGSGNANPSVGHGLGVTPQVVLVKGRSQANSWIMYHYGIDGANSRNKYLILNSSGAAGTLANYWGTSASGGVTSSTFGVYADNQSGNNYLNGTHVAYCFAEKQGYSKFGKYVGNGNANGPFIYTGFKPAFVIIKRTDSADNWFVYDNKRSAFNEADEYIRANIANAEGSNNFQIDMLSNGFKTRNSGAFIGALNASGGSYIYMAFAESSFVSSQGIPTTAR